jgi:hypothetical protein
MWIVMLKTLSCFFAVSWHGEMDLVLWEVPSDGEFQVVLTLPVMQCFIVLVECVEGMICMFDAYIHHSKIIHVECE